MLKENDCLFGGGTVMALRFGEYRESVDIDFPVSSVNGYRQLRQLVTQDISDLFQNGTMPFQQTGDVRVDQYGIRTMLSVMGSAIKRRSVVGFFDSLSFSSIPSERGQHSKEL